MKTQLQTLLVAGVLTMALVVPAAANQDDVWDIIEASAERMERAVRAGDLDTMLEAYAEDAILISHRYPTMQGHQAIREFYRYVLGLGAARIKIEPEEVYGNESGIVEVGTTAVYNALDEKVVEFNYITVWKKIGGEWKIIRDVGL
jgi:ketosteroid isomerase-like protein